MDSSSQAQAQVCLVDEVLVDLLTVERHDGNPLQITAQQLVVGLDVDLLERVADAPQDPARVVAQVAALAAVEDEAH
jgi:hypothetical protein